MIIQRKRVAKRLASGLLAGALALGGLAISGGTASAKTPSSPSTNRISGDDRYETAVAVARDYYSTPSSEFGEKGVIIASGETPYDALAAAPLAGLKDAPILLVKSDSLPESVADLLDDHKANFRRAATSQKVFIVGGTSAVSDDVKTAIEAIIHGPTVTTKMEVKRIEGADRYKTAAAVVGQAGLMDANDNLIIVNGTNWADALAAAALAAENVWPIMLTGNGGLNDDAKAVVDTYRLLAGSVKNITLVGGPAVLPTSIEEYLDTKSIRLSDIDRRGGLDRYQTSLLMNLYQLNAAYAALGAEGKSPAFAGTDVALVSGASPWDALAAGPWAAKKNVHIQLTNPASLNPSAAVLAGALGDKAINNPSKLYIIGGKSAVSAANRDGFIAAASGSNTTSSMGCAVHDDELFITFAGKLTVAEAATLTLSATLTNYITKNGVKNVTSTFLSGNGSAYSTDNTGAANYTTFKYPMTSKAAAADVFALSTLAEGTIAGVSRSIAGSSCTVAADTTAPTASVKFVVNSSNQFNHAVVTLSEEHNDSQSVNTGAAAGTTTLSALSSWKYADGSAVFTAAASSTLSATRVSSKTFIVSLSTASAQYSAVTVAAGTAVYLEKTAVKDLSGNAMAADVGASAALDAAKPAITIAAVACTAIDKTKIVRNGLTIEAAAKGIATNGWTLSVVNQRGILMPTVVEDATAKTITITMDTGYHTPGDLVNLVANSGGSTTWVYSSTSTTAPAATTLGPVTYLTAGAGGNAGSQDCTASLSISEPAYLSGTPSVTVANIASTSGVALTTALLGAIGNGTEYTSAAVTFETDYSGPLNISGITATDRIQSNVMASATNIGGTVG